MGKIYKPSIDLIFKKQIRTRNICYAVSVGGIILLNIFPELSNMASWMLGAGISLGYYLHCRVKNAAKVLVHGQLLNDNGVISEIEIGGIRYTLPSNHSRLVDIQNNMKLFSIAVVTIQNKS